MVPTTLGDVVGPVGTDEFIERDLGKAFKFFRGHPAKFQSLLTWPDLNQILSLHQLDSPRLRMVKEGQPIAAESFISYQPARRANAAPHTRLRPTELTEHLQNGATLILDNVDELHGPVAGLAANIEKALRARIQVNMYAGWRTSPGFDLHWDAHDVFILQVSGRKHWKVYPMTREFPVNGDPRKENPPATPIWEGMLEDGDALYIPRGWWHVAIPLDEPTLHLTVGIHRVTGLDFLTWYTDRLRSSTEVRKDLPILGTATDKKEQLQQLRDAFEHSWNPGLLDEYFLSLETQARPRPHFGLPWTATPQGLPPEDTGWAVKWLVPRPAEWKQNGADTIIVRGNGKEATFALAAGPVLEALRLNGTRTLDSLHDSAGGTLSKDTLRLLVMELIHAGLASIVVENGS